MVEPTSGSAPLPSRGLGLTGPHCQYRVCVVSTRCLPFVIFVCFCFGFVFGFVSFFLLIWFYFMDDIFFLNYYCQDICCLLAGCHHTYRLPCVPPRSSCDQYLIWTGVTYIASQKREKKGRQRFGRLFITWWFVSCDQRGVSITSSNRLCRRLFNRYWIHSSWYADVTWELWTSAHLKKTSIELN